MYSRISQCKSKSWSIISCFQKSVFGSQNSKPDYSYIACATFWYPSFWFFCDSFVLCGVCSIILNIFVWQFVLVIIASYCYLVRFLQIMPRYRFVSNIQQTFWISKTKFLPINWATFTIKFVIYFFVSFKFFSCLLKDYIRIQYGALV